MYFYLSFCLLYILVAIITFGTITYKCIKVPVDDKLLEIAESYWEDDIEQKYIEIGNDLIEVNREEK